MLCPFLCLKMSLVVLGDWSPERTPEKLTFPNSEVCVLNQAGAEGVRNEGSRSGEAWDEYLYSSIALKRLPSCSSLSPAAMQTLVTRSSRALKRRE